MHRLTILPPDSTLVCSLLSFSKYILRVPPGLLLMCLCVYVWVCISHTYCSCALNENTLLPEKKEKGKKNLLVFPHDCGTIIASRSPSPVPGKIAGLAGICIIVFRAIVGGFGLLTQSYRLATCPEQMNSAFVQHYYLFLQCYFWVMNNLIKYYKTI